MTPNIILSKEIGLKITSDSSFVNRQHDYGGEVRCGVIDPRSPEGEKSRGRTTYLGFSPKGVFDEVCVETGT